MTKNKTVPYDVAKQLRTLEEMDAYLDAWFEEFPHDAPGIARALGAVTRASGLGEALKNAGLSAKSGVGNTDT